MLTGSSVMVFFLRGKNEERDDQARKAEEDGEFDHVRRSQEPSILCRQPLPRVPGIGLLLRPLAPR